MLDDAGTKRTEPSLLRLAVGISILFALGIAALIVLSRPDSVQPGSDLLSRTASSMQEIRTFIETSTEAEVSAVLLNRMGWRVSVPKVSEEVPDGVGFSQVHPGVDIPVLVYHDDTAEDLVISIVSYAFLDTHEEYFSIAPRVMEALETERRFVLPPGHESQLLWRSGDEIFIATGPQPIDTLTTQLRP